MAKILIADDEQIIRDMYINKLQSEGFEVESAVDGDDAFKKAESFKPDLILLDILMPKMDGMQTLAKIRKSGWGDNMPCIILTNIDSSDAMLSEIIKERPSYYILKVHSTPSEITEKIKEVLEIHKTKLV